MFCHDGPTDPPTTTPHSPSLLIFPEKTSPYRVKITFLYNSCKRLLQHFTQKTLIVASKSGVSYECNS